MKVIKIIPEQKGGEKAQPWFIILKEGMRIRYDSYTGRTVIQDEDIPYYIATNYELFQHLVGILFMDGESMVTVNEDSRYLKQ